VLAWHALRKIHGCTSTAYSGAAILQPASSAGTAAVLGIIGPSLNDVPLSLKVRYQKATARVPLVEVHGQSHDVLIVPSWVCWRPA